MELKFEAKFELDAKTVLGRIENEVRRRHGAGVKVTSCWFDDHIAHITVEKLP